MHLHPHTQSFGDGPSRAFPSAERLGPSQPLVEFWSPFKPPNNLRKTNPRFKQILAQVPGLYQLWELAPVRGPGQAVRGLPHELQQAQGERRGEPGEGSSARVSGLTNKF